MDFQVFDFDFSAPVLSRRQRCTVQMQDNAEAHGVAWLG